MSEALKRMIMELTEEECATLLEEFVLRTHRISSCQQKSRQPKLSAKR